jgi:hypothetical protein
MEEKLQIRRQPPKKPLFENKNEESNNTPIKEIEKTETKKNEKILTLTPISLNKLDLSKLDKKEEKIILKKTPSTNTLNKSPLTSPRTTTLNKSPSILNFLSSPRSNNISRTPSMSSFSTLLSPRNKKMEEDLTLTSPRGNKVNEFSINSTILNNVFVASYKEWDFSNVELTKRNNSLFEKNILDFENVFLKFK